MEEFRFNFEDPKISRYKGDQGAGDEEDKQSKDQERLVKHEKFQILDPENSFRPKGSPAEILGRLNLGFDEEVLKKYGWKVEVRQNKDGAKVVMKKGGA